MLTHVDYHFYGSESTLYHKGGILHVLMERSKKELERQRVARYCHSKRFERWPY
jgi:hypothetical protein